MSTKPSTMRTRRRMCLEIAEAIKEHVFKKHGVLIDEDEIRLDIECRLPLTYAESEEEWQRMKDGEPEPPRGPSRLDRLRSALGLEDRAIPLGQILDAAIERLSK